MSVRKIAEQVGNYVHTFTLGNSRPYGASVFLVGWDKQVGPSIYTIEPSGLCIKNFAGAIGKKAQQAKAEIEKLENRDELGKADLAKKAMHALFAVRDGDAAGQRVEMAWVGEDTGGLFTVIAAAEIANWEKCSLIICPRCFANMPLTLDSKSRADLVKKAMHALFAVRDSGAVGHRVRWRGLCGEGDCQLGESGVLAEYLPSLFSRIRL